MFMPRLLVLIALLTLALPGAPLAHPNHSKKVMGTVTMADAVHVMVKTADGKEQTIVVNAQTKLRRGKTAVKADALKVGTRVVITLTVKEPPTAAEIEVGTAPAASKK
jgi:hypothetical protein